MSIWLYILVSAAVSYLIRVTPLVLIRREIRSRVLRYGVKLLVFNVAVVLEVLLSVYALGIPLEPLSILGPAGPVVLWVLANVVFVVYDLALEGLIVQYLNRVHDRLGKLLRGK